jgi:iron-sulfur cluster assembly protein
MITATDTATRKIVENLRRRGHGLGIRLGIRTTGCSGLAYVLEYVDQVSADDMAFEHDRFCCCGRSQSMTYLQDVEIDYVRQGLNEGFEFRNPVRTRPLWLRRKFPSLICTIPDLITNP